MVRQSRRPVHQQRCITNHELLCRLNGQLEIKHRFLLHLALTLELRKYEVVRRLSSRTRGILSR